MTLMEFHMKKIFNVFFEVLATVCFVCVCTGCGYNTLVEQREAVTSQWANVENQYQRRADLIPNLVATVQGYAKHENEVFTDIAEARGKLSGSPVIDSSITEDPEAFAQYQKMQNQLGTSLGRLIAISEAYPELKANENFRDLQSQLEGTENRIATERKRYNDAARTYNVTRQKIPTVLVANIFGFKEKAYFTASEGAQKAPAVNFN